MIKNTITQQTKIQATKERIITLETNLHRMLYTSQMMRNLMLDLLDLACMENNTLKINNDYFCLQLVIEKAFFIVDHIANMKRIKLVKLISKDNEKNFAQIFGDERRFIQILVNFLSNALKFSNKCSQIIVQLIVNDCRTINKKIKRAKTKKIASVSSSESSLLNNEV